MLHRAGAAHKSKAWRSREVEVWWRAITGA